MQVFLLEENNKKNKIKSFFKKVEIKNDKILLNCKLNKMNIKGKIKLAKELNKINIKNIILSKEIKKDKEFINLLYSNNFNIINGKKLFKEIIYILIEEIFEKKNIKMQEKQISIMTNKMDSYSKNLINVFSRKFKTLNVVTNNIPYFVTLKEQLWEEEGIVIILTNNKKKAMVKSDIIINIDFPEEVVNTYHICDEAIIINLEEKIKIKKKRFTGQIINDYKIRAKEESKLSEFLNKKEYKKYEAKDLAEVYIENNPEELQNIIIYK